MIQDIVIVTMECK